MSTTLDRPKPTLESLRPALAAFGHAHPVIRRIELFGSVARGESHPLSDVDVVVHLIPGSLPRGIAGFGYLSDLEEELAARLGCPVDLVEHGAVENARRIGNNALPRAVDRDALTVYELDPAAD